MTKQGSSLRDIARSALGVGVATAAGLVGWVVGGKILAIELGASGVGVFGLLRQLLQTFTVYATFNGSNALVQGLACRSDSERGRYAHSVASIYGAGAFVVASVLFGGAAWLGPWLVPHPEAARLLRWLALAVIAATAQSYFTGVLNGYRAERAFVRSQLLGPATAVAVALPMAILVRRGQPAGLVLILALPGAVVALAAMAAARKSGWFSPSRVGRVNRDDASRFYKTSAVLFASGLLVTGAQYIVNRAVVTHHGLEQGGAFWVAWTLSMTYVTVLLSSYGTFYMPALAALEDRALRQEMIHGYLSLALAVMPVLVSLVALMKPWVVLAMFSPSLLPALTVMRWMLIGDLFKGVAWVLAFPMLAFNDMRWFFWSEALFYLGLIGATWGWLELGGSLEGVGAVFALLYAGYFVAMWVYAARAHGLRIRPGEVMRFVGGVALVTVTSWMTWNDQRVRLAPSILVVLLVAAYVYGALRVGRDSVLKRGA